MRRAVRAASIITALSCTSAWAGNPTLLEKYKEWSAFAAAGTPKVCFALAQPKQSTPKGIKRGPVYFYISQWPADGVTNEVSVKMGYPFGPGAKATATVGNAKRRQRSTSAGSTREAKSAAGSPRVSETSKSRKGMESPSPRPFM